MRREKNKRKADKLIEEVYALKTIKDDEISKFGIMNEKEVKDILQDQSSTSRDRIKARVVGYKPFHNRLIQFKERFPDYRIHLSKGNKKTTKSKKKSSVKKKEPLVEDNNHLHCEDTKQESIDSDRISEDQHNSKDEEILANRLCEIKNNSDKHKKSSNENGTSLANKKLKLIEDNISENANKQPSEIKLCSITREAAVKRFTEFLKEQDSTRDTQVSAEDLQTNHKHVTTVQTKPVDDFFVTGSDEEENHTNASTSYTRLEIPTKSLCSSNIAKMQNARFNYGKRTENSKAQKNNQFKKQLRGEKMTGCTKYSDKQSSTMKQEKRTSNRIRKDTNKNNSSVVDDKKETADLHPSWLAKKKQQEIMTQQFQGKKIVFADD